MKVATALYAAGRSVLDAIGLEHTDEIVEVHLTPHQYADLRRSFELGHDMDAIRAAEDAERTGRCRSGVRMLVGHTAIFVKRNTP